MTVYRIEDKNGDGPFCYRNGTVKSDKTIRFNCGWLYAFDDVSCFLRDSYKLFFKSEEYILYEIEIKKPYKYGGYDEHEVKFFPSDIITKRRVEKEIDHEQ